MKTRTRLCSKWPQLAKCSPLLALTILTSLAAPALAWPIDSKANLPSLSMLQSPTTRPSPIDSLRSLIASEAFQTAAASDPSLIDDAERLWDDLAIERSEVPSASPGVAGNPGASPKQVEFQRAFFAQAHRVYAGSGANQSGKTITLGGLCFCKWLRDNAQDGDIYWVIAKSAETIRDIPHRTLWEFLPRGMFPDGMAYNPKLGFGMISTLHLRLPGNRGQCEVWFKTEEQDLISFESSRLNGIWWTECDREALFDAIFPRLAARRGWLLMDFVPKQAWHKFRLKVPAETGDPYIYHARFCMRDNAHNLPPGEIDFQRSKMTPEEAAVRIDGEDGAAFGIVYKEFDPKRHVCQPFEIPARWPRWRMMDYGYRNPTAFLWAALAPRGHNSFPRERVYVYRENYEREQTVPTTAGQVKELSKGETYRGPVICDPSTYNATQADGSSIAKAFALEGLEFTPIARDNPGDEKAQVATVRKWFEGDKIIFFSTCQNAIREHQSWRYKENRDGETPGSEPFEDKNNHTCDALRYFIATGPTYDTPKIKCFNPEVDGDVKDDEDSPFHMAKFKHAQR